MGESRRRVRRTMMAITVLSLAPVFLRLSLSPDSFPHPHPPSIASSLAPSPFFLPLPPPLALSLFLAISPSFDSCFHASFVCVRRSFDPLSLISSIFPHAPHLCRRFCVSSSLISLAASLSLAPSLSLCLSVSRAHPKPPSLSRLSHSSTATVSLSPLMLS